MSYKNEGRGKAIAEHFDTYLFGYWFLIFAAAVYPTVIVRNNEIKRLYDASPPFREYVTTCAKNTSKSVTICKVDAYNLKIGVRK